MPRLLSQHPLNLYQTYYSSTRESIHYMQIVRHITHNSNPIKLYTQWPRLQWPPLHGPYIINIANHPPSRRRARPMPWYGTRVLRAPDSTPTSLLIDVRSLSAQMVFRHRGNTCHYGHEEQEENWESNYQSPCQEPLFTSWAMAPDHPDLLTSFGMKEKTNICRESSHHDFSAGLPGKSAIFFH